MRWLCSAVRCWRRDLKSALLLRLLAFRAAVRCMAVRRRRAAQGLIAGPITKSTIILAFGGAFDSAAVHIAGPCLAVGVVHPTHLGAHKRGHLDAARCGARLGVRWRWRWVAPHWRAVRCWVGSWCGATPGLALLPLCLAFSFALPGLRVRCCARCCICVAELIPFIFVGISPALAPPMAGAAGRCLIAAGRGLGVGVAERGGVAAGSLPAVVWAARAGAAVLAAWLAGRWCGTVPCPRAVRLQLRARDRTTSSLPRPAPTLAVLCAVF